MRKATEQNTEDAKRKAIRKALSDGQELLLSVSLCVKGSSPLLDRAFSVTLQDLFCEVGGDLLFPLERLHASRGTVALFLVRDGVEPEKLEPLFSGFRNRHPLGELVDFSFWKMEGERLVSFDETGKPKTVSLATMYDGLKAYVDSQ